MAGPLAILASALAAQEGNIGLSAVRARQFPNQEVRGRPPQSADAFGSALAVGDFDGDGEDDLAIGIPFDDGIAGSEVSDAGGVVVHYGRARIGLEFDSRSGFLAQIPGAGEEPGDLHGWALAACDFDGDGDDDLAVGAIGEDLGATSAAGAVFVYLGRTGGLLQFPDGVWTQDSPGVPDVAEANDLFGSALACGDFDDDDFDDLVIAAQDEMVGAAPAAGSVLVLPGSPTGPSSTEAVLLHQDEPLVDDVCEPLDRFGGSLVVGDFDGDGFDDLAVGVPGEDDQAGLVQVFKGFLFGLVVDDVIVSQTAIGGQSEAGDRFGHALASGDFDFDGRHDLAVGAPFEHLGIAGSIPDTGAVFVLFGSKSGFDFDRTEFWSQDSILGSSASEPDDRFGFALAAGDFDRDGRDDLALGSPGEEVTGPLDGALLVLMGEFGGLTASRRRFIAAGVEGFPGESAEHGRLFGSPLATGDFDADGHADLAAGAPLEDDAGLSDVGSATVLYGSVFADGFGSESTQYWSSTTPPPFQATRKEMP